MRHLEDNDFSNKPASEQLIFLGSTAPVSEPHFRAHMRTLHMKEVEFVMVTEVTRKLNFMPISGHLGEITRSHLWFYFLFILVSDIHKTYFFFPFPFFFPFFFD